MHLLSASATAVIRTSPNNRAHPQVLTSIKGTPLYMAPELVQEQPYNHTVGVHAPLSFFDGWVKVVAGEEGSRETWQQPCQHCLHRRRNLGRCAASHPCVRFAGPLRGRGGRPLTLPWDALAPLLLLVNIGVKLDHTLTVGKHAGRIAEHPLLIKDPCQSHGRACMSK